jgi:hypothetical protein
MSQYLVYKRKFIESEEKSKQVNVYIDNVIIPNVIKIRENILNEDSFTDTNDYAIQVKTFSFIKIMVRELTKEEFSDQLHEVAEEVYDEIDNHPLPLRIKNFLENKDYMEFTGHKNNIIKFNSKGFYKYESFQVDMDLLSSLGSKIMVENKLYHIFLNKFQNLFDVSEGVPSFSVSITSEGNLKIGFNVLKLYYLEEKEVAFIHDMIEKINEKYGYGYLVGDEDIEL